MATRKSKFDDKFKSTLPRECRIENERSERNVKDEQPKLSFNFKDFDTSQCPPGQTFEQWQKEGRLSVLMKKFIDVCSYNRTEAEQKKLLKVYGDFPKSSHFKKPPHITGEVQWGTIQRIGGQKPRLAGYIIGSVFYPVFLDKDHVFYPSKRNNRMLIYIWQQIHRPVMDIEMAL